MVVFSSVLSLLFKGKMNHLHRKEQSVSEAHLTGVYQADRNNCGNLLQGKIACIMLEISWLFIIFSLRRLPLSLFMQYTWDITFWMENLWIIKAKAILFCGILKND